MKQGYICDLCHKFHPTPEDATHCESKHAPIAGAEIVAARYKQPDWSDPGKYPHRIELRFGEWNQIYEVVRGYRSAKDQQGVEQQRGPSRVVQTNSAFDAMNQAKLALPMPALFRQYGLPETPEVPETCPFCHQPATLVIATPPPTGVWIFKCHHEGCPASERLQGKDEIGFVALMESLDRKEAFKCYLELAGVRVSAKS